MTVGPVSGSALAGFGQSPYAPAGQSGSPGDQATHDRGRRRPPADWHEALAELEGDVLEAQESLARGRADEIAAWGRRSSDWVPPSGLGPIPTDLRERAAILLQHQLSVAEALVERITQSQKQRDVAARMSYGDERPTASFIDRAL
ncbi:hypothetical protein SAMN05660748_0581 [Blastococcus aggregatus]|uniref:FlgN protein n=1 Tax=Blastococcus aggregatus TaxID=38502 RepID=A0A285UYY4_9ACTN|nr:hypothetical protein [Blastococcus aggregatus]SOC47030.1 hypothetical protein SAMN05660748_0581 [Blastococcus aggregatus]